MTVPDRVHMVIPCNELSGPQQGLVFSEDQQREMVREVSSYILVGVT